MFNINKRTAKYVTIIRIKVPPIIAIKLNMKLFSFFFICLTPLVTDNKENIKENNKPSSVNQFDKRGGNWNGK